MSRRRIIHGKLAKMTVPVQEKRELPAQPASRTDKPSLNQGSNGFYRVRASGAALKEWRDKNTGFKAPMERRKQTPWLKSQKRNQTDEE